MNASKLAGDLAAAALATPQDLLGAHAEERSRRSGVRITSWHPEAIAALLLPDGDERPMRALHPGRFEAWLPGATLERTAAATTRPRRCMPPSRFRTMGCPIRSRSDCRRPPGWY